MSIALPPVIEAHLAAVNAGDVTLEVLDVIDHHGDFIVRAKYDGTYDKTNVPDPLILTNYYSLRDGKIITLAVISTPPADA